VLRRFDRFFVPVTWAAAALTALALFVGPELIGAKNDNAPRYAAIAGGGGGAAAPQGKALFVSNCGGCHTLARASTSGSVGPNLDQLKPGVALVKTTVTNGKGSMPAFGGQLKPAEIDAVAKFVAGVETAATPTATATATAAAEIKATTVPTDHGPDGITVAGGTVWVANASAGTLQRFDAATGKQAGTAVKVGSQPDNPLVTGSTVWVALSGDDAVARVQGGKVTRIPVGKAPEDLAVSGAFVWVTNAGDGTVSRIDRATGKVSGAPIRVGGRPLGIAASGDTVWVSSFDDGTVWRLDAGSGARRGAPVKVGGSVTRLSDRRTVQVGEDPRDLVVSGGTVWVADSGDDTVSRIDAASAKPAGDPVAVGDDPIGVAAGGGSVWSTDFRDDTLSRFPAR
jgi:YVTN family beta-propeller protein